MAWLSGGAKANRSSLNNEYCELSLGIPVASNLPIGLPYRAVGTDPHEYLVPVYRPVSVQRKADDRPGTTAPQAARRKGRVSPAPCGTLFHTPLGVLPH
ncbi:MAG TPA: hypothetical protein VKZ57_02410 [Sphingobacterium sp.]|nr:hypothetical protein [Sphingobacterium sp.]